MATGSTGWFNAGNNPTVQTICETELLRSTTTVTVFWTVRMKLTSAESFLGTGSLEVSSTCSGGGSSGWQTIKAHDTRWSGTTEHSYSGSYTFSNSSTTTQTFTVNFSSRSDYFSSSGIFSTFVSVNLEGYKPYATITSFSMKSSTLNSITLQYTVDSECDWAQYMIEGNSWLDLPNSNTILTTDGTNRLTPNTTYRIKIRLRRKDNQQWSESDFVYMTTQSQAVFTSVPDTIIGESQTITWTNPSGATTSIKLYRSNGTTVINDFGTVTGTNLTYTANANTIYSLTPNDTNYKARYVITTTAENGTNYTSYADFNFIVDPTTNKPTFTNWTYSDINTDSSTGTTRLTKSNQVLIKNYSIVRARITTTNRAIAKNYATMTDNGAMYKFIIGTQTPLTASYSSTSTVQLDSLIATTNILNLYAVDSRGLETGVEKELTIGTNFIEYEDLKITSVNAVRSNGGASSEVTLTVNGSFWNKKFGTNTSAVTNHIKSITYEYKETNSDTWISGVTTITATETNNSYIGTSAIQGDLGSDGFNISKSFNIRVTVKDELSSKSYTLTIGAGVPAIAISSDNKVAIGQKYDTTLGGALQVNGQIYQSGEKLYPFPKVLWENISPSSSITTRSITLNSDDYDMYEVIYRNHNTDNNMMSQKSIKGNNCTLLAQNGGTQSNTYLRNILYVDDTNLTIDRCANPRSRIYARMGDSNIYNRLQNR